MAWSGVVRILDAETVECLAHKQLAKVMNSEFEKDQVVTLYNMKPIFDEITDTWYLQWQEDSIKVIIPVEQEVTWWNVKEVCAGMGGIAQGLEAVGFTKVAALDCNPLMCETLRKNGTPGVVLGDVLVAADRAALHQTPSPMRCLVASGFPCQPLSSQGDMKGQADPRSRPFNAVLKVAWEQQCGALLLENVKGALDADYIQEGIQRLAWSLSMDIVQTVLNLDRTWPCRRTRWWAILKPVKYQITCIPDLPEDPMLAVVGQLFPLWPRWDPTIEEELHLTDYELEIMQDRRFGRDLRQLARDDVVPCFLHSYSNALRGCPCGCRQGGFSHHRLIRDGVRGFYIVSMVTGRHRWLHPREAALLCGLDPQMALPEELRAGLCLVGQCASPIQSAWVGAHLIDAAQHSSGTPSRTLLLYKMWLLRQAHGMVPKKALAPLRLTDGHDGSEISLRLGGLTTVGDILAAEKRLHGGGMLWSVTDVYGKLPQDYDLSQGAVTGSLELHHRQKRQKKNIEIEPIEVSVVEKQSDGSTNIHTMTVMKGIFVFEVMQKVPGLSHIYYKGILDDEGNEWRLDERILQKVTFVQYHLHHEICAWGCLSVGEKGLGNVCIDRWAKRMLNEMNELGHSTWVPALQCSLLVQHTEDVMLNHWLVAALHGVLRGCAALFGHWVYMEMKVTGNLLQVSVWDGLDHQGRQHMLIFAEKARQILVVRTLAIGSVFLC